MSYESKLRPSGSSKISGTSRMDLMKGPLRATVSSFRAVVRKEDVGRTILAAVSGKKEAYDHSYSGCTILHTHSSSSSSWRACRSV